MRQINVPLLSRAELLDKYHYDPLTGALVRKYKMGRYEVGGQIGKVDAKGNRIIRLKMKSGGYGMMALGRFIWFLVTGTLPNNYVRYKDGDNTNFRADNLKLGRQINTPENIYKHAVEQKLKKAASNG